MNLVVMSCSQCETSVLGVKHTSSVTVKIGSHNCGNHVSMRDDRVFHLSTAEVQLLMAECQKEVSS